MKDIVKAKGYLTLGSRFRRLGERLQADVQVMADEHGLEVPAALFPTMHAIYGAGATTVGEIAKTLGISQPGATRNINQLEKLGLVSIRQSDEDGRVRHISLTRKCRADVEKAQEELWPRIERAVAEICQPLKGGLLDMLTAIERELDEQPLAERSRKSKTR